MGHAEENLLMTHPGKRWIKRFNGSLPANPWHWSGYLRGTWIPLTLVRIPGGDLKPLTLVRVPVGYQNTPDTDQNTCGVPEYPWHWSGYLEGTLNPWHWSGYLGGTWISLTLVRVPAGYLNTPDTGQGTCGVPEYPWHWSGYLRGTWIPLTPVRVPAGYLNTPDTGQTMKEEVVVVKL